MRLTVRSLIVSTGQPQEWSSFSSRCGAAAMCLGVPGQIIEIHDKVAVVDFWGTEKRIKLDILEEPVLPGDYILDHAGYAIRRIPIEDVPDTLAMYEIVLCEAGEDPIARDIMDELELKPV